MSGATRNRTCMRCLTPRPAETTGHFAYESYLYEIDLCEMHGRMFDADMANWLRLARDVGPLIRENVDNTVVPFPVVDAGVEYRDPRPDMSNEEISLEALSYTFTDHASFRMLKRKISKTDIYRLISTKNKTVRQSEDHADALVYTTEDLMVVVNPARKRVITVAFRHEDKRELQRSGT